MTFVCSSSISFIGLAGAAIIIIPDVLHCNAIRGAHAAPRLWPSMNMCLKPMLPARAAADTASSIVSSANVTFSGLEKAPCP